MKFAPVSRTASGLVRAAILAIALVALLAPAALAEDGYLGVMIQSVDETLAAALDLESADGVLVSEVVENSPAETAGLQRGDLILSVNGRSVDDPSRFTRRIRRVDAGETATLELVRKGKPMTLTATLEEVPEDEFFGRAPRHIRMHSGDGLWIDEGGDDIKVFAPRAGFSSLGSGAQLGVNVHSIDEELGRYFGTDEGVLVLGVNEDSAAEDAGLQTGDVIVSVDGEAVDSTVELHEVLAEFEPGDEVAIGFLRDKREQTADVELGEDPGLHFVRDLKGFGGHPGTIHIERAPHHSGPRHYRMRIHEPDDIHEELQRLREHLERLEEELDQVESREG
jgi:serine protease Do